MRRVWDYIGFAVGFAGFGYSVLWLFGLRGRLVLPAGLHSLAIAAAALLPLWLFWGLIDRRRRDGGPAANSRATAALLRPPRRGPPLRTVKPRRQFGLRGAPD